MTKKQWDYKKYNYRYYHIQIKDTTWFLYKDNDTYFFSDTEPDKGEPTQLPDKYDVKINKITKKPELIEKKTVSDSIDDFFANEKKDEKTSDKKESTTKKKRRYPTERHDKYHRWKY